jgi:hypothetical protein
MLISQKNRSGFIRSSCGNDQLMSDGSLADLLEIESILDDVRLSDEDRTAFSPTKAGLMPRGLKGDKRQADAIGNAVMFARSRHRTIRVKCPYECNLRSFRIRRC